MPTIQARPVFPFAAIVGQEAMKFALLLHAVDPQLGGVMIFGDRGTAKSTAVRSLAALLPPVQAVAGCVYRCDPRDPTSMCSDCSARVEAGESLKSEAAARPVVDLPLGATEDRILGSLDLEAALARGERRFQPGLLAEANRGFLYIDEVNLLADHLVDLLLDAVASGENIVEREGLSVRHPARFTLVGSANPEEGELRPQLLDRFALSVRVTTLTQPDARAEVLRRRLEFSDDPIGFLNRWRPAQEALAEQVRSAQDRLENVAVGDDIFEAIARLGAEAGAIGHRAEVAIVRAARAAAALKGLAFVDRQSLRQAAPLALPHRLSDARDSLDSLIDEVIADATSAPSR